MSRPPISYKRTCISHCQCDNVCNYRFSGQLKRGDLMGIKVRDALNVGGLKGAKVLAGHAGLDREITHVDVFEEPDVVKWLRSNTLMLTTFYAVKDDREAQVNIIRKMAEAGVAGLVIDPKMYLGELSEDILKLADELNLPIIELPQEVGYIDVITPIIDTILDRESRLDSRWREINELFTNIILNKGGFQRIADTLSELTGCSLVLLDKYANVLAWVDRQPGDGCLALFAGEGNAISLVNAAVAGKEELRVPIRREIAYAHKNVAILIVPVKAGTEVYGYIVFWDLDRAFDEIDLIALEHASRVTAIELIKQEAIRENRERQRIAFLTQLLNGTFSSEEEIHDRAQGLGIDLRGVGAVMIAEICQVDKHACIKDKVCLADIFEQFRSKIGSLEDLLVTGDGKRVVILPRLSQPQDRDTATNALIRLAERIRAQTESGAGCIKVAVGIGRYYDKLTYIKKSYGEAKNALIVCRKLNGKRGGVLHFERLGLYKLLMKIEDQDELESFYKQVLYPLVKYDEDNKTNLVGTLYEYFASGENRAVTAEKLHIHINTLKYRMNRIKETLNIEDFTMENKTSLFVALKIMRLLNGD